MDSSTAGLVFSITQYDTYYNRRIFTIFQVNLWKIAIIIFSHDFHGGVKLHRF